MIRLNDNYDIISKYKNISRDGGQHNSVRQIVHRVRQIGRKILLAPDERGHHVIWRQLGRRFRAKFWLAAKFASRAVSHQLHRRWHEDVRIAWYVRYPCFSLTFCIYRETPRLSWWGQGLHIGYCTWWWSTRSVITCEFFKCWSGTWNHRTPWWSYWSDLEQASTTLIRLIRDSQEFHADQMSIY